MYLMTHGVTDMSHRTRRSRWLVILVLAVIAAGCIAFVVYLCKPSMVIRDRKGLRAVLLMPGDLRGFAVDEHAKPGDTFSYTLKTERTGIKRWALQIDTKAAHREYWQDRFGAYAAERRFMVSDQYKRGSNVVLKGYTAARKDYCWLSLEESQTSDDLTVVFVYQNRRVNSKLRRCVARVDSYVRRLWYLFGKEPPIVDVRAS